MEEPREVVHAQQRARCFLIREERVAPLSRETRICTVLDRHRLDWCRQSAVALAPDQGDYLPVVRESTHARIGTRGVGMAQRETKIAANQAVDTGIDGRVGSSTDTILTERQRAANPAFNFHLAHGKAGVELGVADQHDMCRG